MKHAVWALFLALIASCTYAQTEGVRWTRDATGWHASTPVYEVQVTPEGNWRSLKVLGVEFLVGPPKMAAAGYFYQDKVLKLPEMEQVAPRSLLAQSDLARLRCDLAQDAMTWTLTNLSAKRLLYILVLDPAVTAVRDSKGRFTKPPVSNQWAESTWFREGTRLQISGSTKLWGWIETRQVWELDLDPGQTKQVTFQMAKATDEEALKASNIKPPEPPAEPVGPMWDLQRFSKAPRVYPAEGFTPQLPEPGNIKGIFYEGMPFEGKPTRVFAWLGIPKTEPGQKVPGMVLVHGGGGTAFEGWVKRWMDRGYAAIAMDTCGCVAGGTHSNRPRHDKGGPAGWGGFDQIDWPREDQWTFHAIADVLLANSLLRSLPEVDADRIGVTGISWGGYLTSLVSGVDTRFRFAAPVYGCGDYLETTFGDRIRGLGADRADRWMRWWDPSVYLKDSKMPMLWVTGSNDFAYWFPALQKSYRTARGSRTLCVRLRMSHGQESGEMPEEIRVFADSILKGDDPLPRITNQGRDGSQVWATFESRLPLSKAELNYTKDSGKWPDRQWESVPAGVQGGKVSASLPEGTTTYYLNLFEDRGCVVSTEHEELAPPKP